MKKTHLINVVAIAATALAILAYRVFLPPTEGFKTYQNRYTLERPELTVGSWLEGEFTDAETGFAPWFTDTFPYSAELSNVISTIKSLYGIDYKVNGQNYGEFDLTAPPEDSRPENPDDVFDPLA